LTKRKRTRTPKLRDGVNARNGNENNASAKMKVSTRKT
jgi:hypothetical protein